MQRLQVHVLGNSKIAGSLAVRGSDMILKLKLMFCDICVNSQIVNSFTTGCDIMKKECVTKHESRKSKLLHIIYNVSIPCFHSPFQNYNLAQHSR